MICSGKKSARAWKLLTALNGSFTSHFRTGANEDWWRTNELKRAEWMGAMSSGQLNRPLCKQAQTMDSQRLRTWKTSFGVSWVMTDRLGSGWGFEAWTRKENARRAWKCFHDSNQIKLRTKMNNEAYSSVACQAFGFVSNSDWRAGLGLHDLIYKSLEDVASLIIEMVCQPK